MYYGLTWVIRKTVPPEPEWEFATVAAEQTVTTKRIQECNWLQGA